MGERATVAAVIPTKNVAEFIRGTLDSLWFCDEIIVVDMHSTDATPVICAEYSNVRYFAREDYIYGNFNFGVEQARSEWIIRLDSDERLSVELAEEIVALLSGRPEFDCYVAPFVSYIDGNPIRWGMAWEQPRRKTLFRKGTLRYKVKSEHEDLTSVSGGDIREGVLKGRYHHFAIPSVGRFWQKIDYYTDRDWERTPAGEARYTPAWKLSVGLVKGFLRQYVWHRGYRDGYAGFVLCAMNQAYRLLHEVKGWELKHGMKANHKRVRDEFDRVMREVAQKQRGIK